MAVVAQQERTAYHDVFVEHHVRLLRIAYLLRGDLAQAEDDVAEAFARTWGPWTRGEVRDVGPYLTRAVTNRAYSGHRHRLVVERSPRPRADDVMVDDTIEERDRLRRALAALPNGQRAAVVLRYVGDYSEQMTADVLGVSVGTIKSQVARALGSLRAALRDEEVPE